LGIILTVLVVLAVIIFLVVTHELGHFTSAKLLKIKVTEFFVGFGPRIWSIKKGETEYGFKWFLAGGYVKILGMNPDEEISEEDYPRSYRGSAIWRRAVVIFSGSFVHLMLALIIMFITIWALGIPNYDKATTSIAAIAETKDDGAATPAATAGLQPDDTILAVNGEPVADWEELRGYIVDHPGEPVQLTVVRDGSEVTLDTTLDTRSDGTGYLGVTPQPSIEAYGLLGSLKMTGIWFGKAVQGAAVGFGKIFTPGVWKQLLGISEPTVERPVTVVGISRIGASVAGEGLFYFLNFFAFIMLFLALVNLLPLPPLDGGYLLVLLIEKVRGKEIDLRKLYPISVAVLAFFGILFLLTLRLDIFNPINIP
jgi:membrane-associated protease RseP (regulator of RpoE activity)